jgi:cysteine-rich repeat protein
MKPRLARRSPGLALLASLVALGSAGCSANVDVFGDATGVGGSGGSGGDDTTTSAGGSGSTSSTTSSTTGTTTSTSVSSTSTGTAVCGDGVASPGEACDGSDLGGKSCVDAGFSSPGALACDASCALDTTGCTTTCDGAQLEPGEACDGPFFGAASCADFGFVEPGGLACVGCTTVDPSACTASCNGTLEPGEDCDGMNLNGKTCADLGFVAPGGLACKACGFDTAGCVPTCGNGTLEPGEACDDANAVANDGCSATCELEGTTCANAIPVSLAAGTTTRTGTTVGGGNHTPQGGATDGYNSACTGAAPDRIYAVTVQVKGFVTVTLPRAVAGFDSVVYVGAGASLTGTGNGLAACTGVQQFLCADSYIQQSNTVLNGGEVVSFYATPGTTYYLFVDGYAAADVGAYELVFDLSSGTCGDPLPIQLAAGTPMKLLGRNNDIDVGQFATSGTCGGQPGREVVHEVTVPQGSFSAAVTSVNPTPFNTVVYARTTCDMSSTQLACANNSSQSNSVEAVAGLTGTPVYVFADGSAFNGTNPSGTYQLTFTPPTQ